MSGPVVLIDDEREILIVLSELLADEGYCTICVDDVDRIVEAIEGARPSLFLIDIMLPKATGVEVAEGLREAGFAETPMIAMSASGAMVRYAAESGLFQDAIGKPFEVDNLLDCVEHYVPAH